MVPYRYYPREVQHSCFWGTLSRRRTRLWLVAFNSLRSMEINATTVQSLSFAYALFVCLCRHVQTFSDGSILRDLDLDNTLNGLDPSVHRDVFQVVCFVFRLLPNLKSFGIFEPTDPFFIQILADAIENLKISHFKLWCEPGHDSTLQPLFDSIASSKHLKVFSMRCHSVSLLSESRARQLFDLAFSTTSGLLEIDIDEVRIFFQYLLVLVPEDCDPAMASKRRLRRFNVVSRKEEFPPCYSDNAGFHYLSCLHRLLSKHLPYLYDVGITPQHHAEFQKLIRKERGTHSEESLFMWNKVCAQMELNRVGMALLRPEVLPTVPDGLWSRVLYCALSCEENPSELPWTGIYSMVRALFMGNHTTWSEAPKASCRKGFRTKRPRQESRERQ